MGGGCVTMKRISRVQKSLLLWKAANFGYELAEESPNEWDMEALAKEQTTLKVPGCLLHDMWRAARHAWMQRRYEQGKAALP